MKGIFVASVLTASVSAFPWVLDQPGVDGSLFGAARRNYRRQQPGGGEADPAKCPVNPDHKGAAPFDPRYPYNNARGGAPGKGVGGYQVPAPGDTAHAFVAPGPLDIRGPCPGLNAAANHNFLSHDGITTYTELVDAQQNIYNVGYDLAVLLATLGLTLADGDIVTNRLSIGCDATSRTSFNPTLTGSQPGLNGHNKFEADTSLTRNDFFTHNGDNFRMNGTLFGKMANECGNSFDFACMTRYRKLRYDESRQENPNFYFGPFSLLLFGASSFLYELMPSANNGLKPDLATISSFFGASQQTDGSWTFNNQERIPDNWTNRKDPYTILKVGAEIFAQYGGAPVEFGGATGNGGYNLLNWKAIQNGKLPVAFSPTNVACLLYMLATERVPSSLNGFVTPTVNALEFALTKLSPGFKNLGCPLPLTK